MRRIRKGLNRKSDILIKRQNILIKEKFVLYILRSEYEIRGMNKRICINFQNIRGRINIPLKNSAILLRKLEI